MSDRENLCSPFVSVLVANRGEIAVRIINAAKAKGLKTVAIFSEADSGAPFVRLADRAVMIGSGPSADSYLNLDKVVDAARQSGAEAIHPGYGFLSENADFARLVREAGINFIGPRSETIETMGDKALARGLALSAGVPCLPSFDDVDADDETYLKEAKRIGFPVMVKAVAGGGGRGIRRVDDESDLPRVLDAVRKEASAAFGRPHLVLEKYLTKARHIEIQVVGDSHGNIHHVGERDCSLQRRHQKIVEEAPSPAVNQVLRSAMAEAALKLAHAANYVGIGTVEFLLDESGDFFFLEMNPRLQVEHPITEMVYGIDLVGLQFDIAQGRAVEKTWPDEPARHAIELRLFAEDPEDNFCPQAGRVQQWTPAEGEGIRIDHGLSDSTDVPPYYDSMVAKIIASGANRDDARFRLARALSESRLLGLPTNGAYLHDLVQQEAFVTGGYTTEYLGDYLWQPNKEVAPRLVVACALFSAGLSQSMGVPRSVPRFDSFLAATSAVHFHLGEASYSATLKRGEGYFSVKWDQRELDARIIEVSADRLRVRTGTLEEDIHFVFDGSTIFIWYDDRQYICTPYRKSTDIAIKVREGLEDLHTQSKITAPMGGVISEILIKENETVEKGQCLLRIEAMKMIHDITAPKPGVVSSIHVAPSSYVNRMDLLAEIDH